MKVMNFVFIKICILAMLAFSSCSNNIENEQELITTVVYTLSDTTGNVAKLTFKDLDGDGGVAPVYISEGVIQANHKYAGELALYNEANNPVENIGLEVQKEAENHQFFYVNDLNIRVQYADYDINKYPLGLRTTFETGISGSGVFKIILRHMPDKKANGVSSGDISLAGGETDVEIDFKMEIK